MPDPTERHRDQTFPASIERRCILRVEAMSRQFSNSGLRFKKSKGRLRVSLHGECEAIQESETGADARFPFVVRQIIAIGLVSFPLREQARDLVLRSC